MSLFASIKMGLTVILAAGGLAGPVAVIVYTSSRASANDLDELAAKHSVLKQSHEDLAARIERDRSELQRRLELMDAKQDHMIEMLEEQLRRRGR